MTQVDIAWAVGTVTNWVVDSPQLPSKASAPLYCGSVGIQTYISIFFRGSRNLGEDVRIQEREGKREIDPLIFKYGLNLIYFLNCVELMLPIGHQHDISEHKPDDLPLRSQVQRAKNTWIWKIQSRNREEK